MIIGALEHLCSEHRNISALLNILERQMGGIAAGDRPDYQLMYEILHYLAFYPDKYHHPFEDLLVTRLLQRQPDRKPEVVPVELQHRSIAEQSVHLLEQVKQILLGLIVSRQPLVEAGYAYVQEYRDHMQYEEDRIFPILTGNLTTRDWLELTTAFHWRHDPLFAAQVSEDYRYLRDCITVEGAGTWPWEEIHDNHCTVCSEYH